MALVATIASGPRAAASVGLGAALATANLWTLARIVADAMQPSLGQSVVVETVSGASGTIASGRVVHANPDGYTIGIGNWTSHVGSPAIYPLDYDIFKDLQPVALLAASPLWIVGSFSENGQTGR